MPQRPSLLGGELTGADRAAERDLPRPGVWAGEDGADLRPLTQDETDMLIRNELLQEFTSGDDHRDIVGALGGRDWYRVSVDDALGHGARRQRGGIDSDPLVRVLAHRAWGDRDQRWFEERGVRKGEPVVALFGRPARWTPATAVVATVWPGETRLGHVTHDARPGEVVGVVERGRSRPMSVGFRVSDRPRVKRPRVAPSNE